MLRLSFKYDMSNDEDAHVYMDQLDNTYVASGKHGYSYRLYLVHFLGHFTGLYLVHRVHGARKGQSQATGRQH